ncbi:MAG: ABC transporter substrate-binding protein [Akkermansiaceae bacterium]|nr:ABC transporter substrate-binding protein [Akkermansiaceae bacterium]
MSVIPHHPLGFVPSLEVLPLIGTTLQPPASPTPPLRLRACSSYGSIARGMLTAELSGGILPWEVFINEVLALPGQRAHWMVPLFLHPCPTEILVKDSVFKYLHPSRSGTRVKPPGRLVFGIESRSSLTRSQVRAWLARWNHKSAIQLEFKVLPMNLMLEGVKAEILDGIIVPTPWGKYAESAGVGKVDPHFTPGLLSQKLALVLRRDVSENPFPDPSAAALDLTAARRQLRNPSVLLKAAAEMARHGRPFLPAAIIGGSAELHLQQNDPAEFTPSSAQLVHELLILRDLSALPPQIAPTRQTALLLAAASEPTQVPHSLSKTPPRPD